MVRLTGLYKHKGEKGQYLTGRIGAARLVVLPNKHKQSDTDPDYIAYIKENKREVE